MLILMYQAVCCLHNGLSRTVVLFQFEEFAVFISVAKCQDIVYICPTETVYALSIITNNTHFQPFLCQLPYNLVLSKIRVLILVHQHKLESCHIFLSYIFIFCKEHISIYKYVVEVHSVSLFQPLAIL